ncbi:nucleolar MIF4G domain-containing protein 1 homolog [Cherax quadricarinatus]
MKVKKTGKVMQSSGFRTKILGRKHDRKLKRQQKKQQRALFYTRFHKVNKPSEVKMQTKVQQLHEHEETGKKKLKKNKIPEKHEAMDEPVSAASDEEVGGFKLSSSSSDRMARLQEYVRRATGIENDDSRMSSKETKVQQTKFQTQPEGELLIKDKQKLKSLRKGQEMDTKEVNKLARLLGYRKPHQKKKVASIFADDFGSILEDIEDGTMVNIDKYKEDDVIHDSDEEYEKDMMAVLGEKANSMQRETTKDDSDDSDNAYDKDLSESGNSLSNNEDDVNSDENDSTNNLENSPFSYRSDIEQSDNCDDDEGGEGDEKEKDEQDEDNDDENDEEDNDEEDNDEDDDEEDMENFLDLEAEESDREESDGNSDLTYDFRNDPELAFEGGCGYYSKPEILKNGEENDIDRYSSNSDDDEDLEGFVVSDGHVEFSSCSDELPSEFSDSSPVMRQRMIIISDESDGNGSSPENSVKNNPSSQGTVEDVIPRKQKDTPKIREKKLYKKIKNKNVNLDIYNSDEDEDSNLARISYLSKRVAPKRKKRAVLTSSSDEDSSVQNQRQKKKMKQQISNEEADSTVEAEFINSEILSNNSIQKAYSYKDVKYDSESKESQCTGEFSSDEDELNEYKIHANSSKVSTSSNDDSPVSMPVQNQRKKKKIKNQVNDRVIDSAVKNIDAKNVEADFTKSKISSNDSIQKKDSYKRDSEFNNESENSQCTGEFSPDEDELNENKIQKTDSYKRDSEFNNESENSQCTGEFSPDEDELNENKIRSDSIKVLICSHDKDSPVQNQRKKKKIKNQVNGEADSIQKTDSYMRDSEFNDESENSQYTGEFSLDEDEVNENKTQSDTIKVLMPSSNEDDEFPPSDDDKFESVVKNISDTDFKEFTKSRISSISSIQKTESHERDSEFDTESKDSQGTVNLFNEYGVSEQIVANRMKCQVSAEFSGSESKDGDLHQQEDCLTEDIYGYLRDKDGNIVKDKDMQAASNGKYIPPALRKLMALDADEKKKEQLANIKKTLKGLLNRLTESNMAGIANQIEEMYVKYSHKDMSDTLTDILLESIVAPTLSTERLVQEHVMLVAVLSSNVGSEVGAHILNEFVIRWHDRMQLLGLGEDVSTKEAENLLLVIANLYNFRVVDALLIYDILHKLALGFSDKEVELILLVLRSVGFTLRKDDPEALKSLVTKIQTQASISQKKNEDSARYSRVCFTLEVLRAIKNNNMAKVPNYDPSHVEHLKKVLKGMVRRGTQAALLKVTLEDLLKARESGRWWIVGSAWSGNLPGEKPPPDHRSLKNFNRKNVLESEFTEKFKQKAAKLQLSCPPRINILYIITEGSEDYLDAFNKLLQLSLPHQQQQEFFSVILLCCQKSKVYNPYYSCLANTMCKFDRKYKNLLKFALWDKFTEIESMKARAVSNLAKFMSHLLGEQTVNLSILKNISFVEIENKMISFLRQTLFSVLIHPMSADALECIFSVLNVSPKLHHLSQGLKLFILKFLVIKKDDNAKYQMLSKRIQCAVDILSRGGGVRL